MSSGVNILDGKAIAEEVHAETQRRVEALEVHGIRPGLAVVLVGDNPASRIYVENKHRTASRLGFFSRKIELPADCPKEQLHEILNALNSDSAIHGILVQSPLPSHLDEEEVVAAISPEKDVDGFHPVNVAKLALGHSDGFVPCTPLGILRLLQHIRFPVPGSHAVVVGRSRIVGKPMALLLLQRGPLGNATVTVAHSQTRNLAAITRQADLLIAAIGQPNFLGSEHVREGAVVIDVGINRIADASAPRGYRLVGDVRFEEVAPICRAITPVPGGVGPMTIAMLLQNTVLAAERAVGLGRS
ncbi:MAG: bifunctional methylenetetrahydrofolate dehydrogenase/methenyltetrahydrofolate cyclohydrolase FolD [Chthoniobacterales bacterium]|nr:bifunctional methylenetetrahydrofolate dehydrogenase/methenyltetrahydrofolate cyclohydrolase FolD [Chthoniobacterales bacterium]